jgi:hypothetical protein
LLSAPDLITESSYPAIIHSEYIVTFAKANDFEFEYVKLFPKTKTLSYKTINFLKGSIGPGKIKRDDARRIVSRLLKIGWDSMIVKRNLPSYELAGAVNCAYFKDGFAENNKAYFVDIKDKRRYRKLVGIKSKSDKNGEKVLVRNWHFGIQAKPLLYPFHVFIIKPHVLFSDEDKVIWESKQRLHRARRSQCRNWWNPEWRDRTLAAMGWLGDKKGKIYIRLADDTSIAVSTQPLFFTSPVSFNDPDSEQPILDVYEDEEDEFFDEDSIEEFSDDE